MDRMINRLIDPNPNSVLSSLSSSLPSLRARVRTYIRADEEGVSLLTHIPIELVLGPRLGCGRGEIHAYKSIDR